MDKSLFYYLFRLGRKPKQFNDLFKSEEIYIDEEGVKGSIIYRNYRAKGKYFSYKKRWFAGSLTLTKKRIVAYAFSKLLINITFEDPRIKKLNIAMNEDHLLSIKFQASTLNQDESGEVEYRFHTCFAKEIIEKLKKETT